MTAGEMSWPVSHSNTVINDKLLYILLYYVYCMKPLTLALVLK